MCKILLLIYFLIFCFGNKANGQELELVECFSPGTERPTKRIVEDQFGFIWMMRWDGFYRYDGKELQFIQPSIGSDFSSYHSSNYILPLDNGDYWLSASELGFSYYSSEQDEFFIYNQFEIDGEKQFVYGRHVEDMDGKYKILSTTDGVFQIDNLGKLIRRIQPALEFGSLNWGRHNANEVRKTVYDKKRNLLWIGGKVGLYSFDFKTEELTWHRCTFDHPTISTKGKWYLINDILLKEDELIMTSWAGGILTYQIEEDHWEQFVFEDQINVPYRSGNTQFGETRNGRLFFAHETREFGSWKKGETNYSIPTSNGEVLGKGIGAHVDRLGFLWTGYLQNVCRYKVNEELPIPKTANIYVKSIFIDEKKQFQKMHRWDNREIVLEEKPDSMRFVFRAIYPLSYDSIFYEYRLQGLENDWKKNGQSENAIFKNLGSGDYKFQARYFDNISQEYIYTGEVELKIPSKPLLNFNLFWWILGISLAGLFGYMFSKFFADKRRQQAEKKYERQLREVQDAALRSQMNPHFLFNSLNSIRYFIVINDNDKAADYLTKFSRLIRMILENSKKKTVPLSEELHLLDLYIKMEQIRFENKFDYKVDAVKVIDSQQVMIPPMLIQPYIENAIIHGINPKEGRGKIELKLKLESPFLTIQIEDNGIGRERSMKLKKESVLKKKSLGLSITKSRLDLADTSNHKADLKIIDLYNEEKKGVGTKVIIRIPMR